MGNFLDNDSSKVYNNFFKKAKYLGYVYGLSYQSIPYDFRKGIKRLNLSKIIKNNIRRINKLTNKKITLISFSYGSKIILYELNKLARKFKENNIANWVAVTPPFLGSLKAIGNIITGDRSFSELGIKKFTALTSIETLSSFEASYQLIKKNIYNDLIKQPWFDYVHER